ncbi:MAG: hypothetical protein ACLS89_05475 [Collinsella sp.]
MSTYAIKADKFFLPAGPQLGGYLMVEDGVFGAWQAAEPSCEIKDYTGSWIAPGMVDTHIHGFYNHSTTDNDPEGIDIARPSSPVAVPPAGYPRRSPMASADQDACAAIARRTRAAARLLWCSHSGHLLGGPLLYHEARGRAEPRLSYRSLPRRSSISGRRLQVVASLRAPWRPSATVPLLMRLL